MNHTGIQLVVTPPPHIQSRSTISSAMYDVVIALLPAFIAATYFFGLNAIVLVFVCVICAVLTEVLIQRLLGRQVTIYDGSALLTGMLLALCLPPATPWWVAAIAAFISIAIAKQLFGGLGHNIFNPALFGRIFITTFLPFFPNYFITPLWWKKTNFFNFLIPYGVGMHGDSMVYKLVDNTGKTVVDAISTATPLRLAHQVGAVKPTYLQLFLGNVKGGNLGETCILALLIGAAYLIYKGHIDLVIPGSIIGTTCLLVWVFGHDPLYHLLAGGLVLGAFFMATDWITSPMTLKGKLVYGIGIGLFVSLIRLFGTRPEGVALGILHMNVVSIFIDRLFLPRRFGERYAHR